MSYRTRHRRGLGQAKIVPGQISFLTTPTGRIPSVQPLIEAGLPIAPYVEHGSWETGQPAIMRYGLDPYRGIMGLGQTTNPNIAAGIQTATENAIQGAAESMSTLLVVIGTGAVAGALGGLLGGFLKRPILMTLGGAAGGGALGYMAYKRWLERTPPPRPDISLELPSAIH